MDRDKIVCTCMYVSVGEIVDSIKKFDLKTVDEVGDAIEAGLGCGGCKPEIEKILNTINDAKN